MARTTFSGPVVSLNGFEGPVSGAQTTDSLTVGTANGTPLTQVRQYTQTITPAAVASAVAAEQTFTVTGLTTADTVVVNPVATGNATAVASARVSAANTLAVTFINPTAGALTPAAGSWKILAFRS